MHTRSQKAANAINATSNAIDAGAAVALWLLAVGLLAVLVSVITRATPAVAAYPAMFDTTGVSGPITALTASGGSDEVMMVIDHRTEQLLVYHVRNQTVLELRTRQDLRELFANARVAGAGPGPDPIAKPTAR